MDFPCQNCGKLNYTCDWACAVEVAKKAGGKVFTPNGLPIRSIKADGTMLEHEHGDHPDYQFPVEVEYVGPPSKDGSYSNETHALIYQDGSIALTLYECCYSIWRLFDGVCLGGFNEPKKWRLVKASQAKILTSHDPLDNTATQD